MNRKEVLWSSSAGPRHVYGLRLICAMYGESATARKKFARKEFVKQLTKGQVEFVFSPHQI